MRRRRFAVLPLVAATALVTAPAGASGRVFSASYVGTGVRVAGVPIVQGEVCSGEQAEQLGIAGVPDEGGACFSASGRLGGVPAETLVDVSVADATGVPVSGTVRVSGPGSYAQTSFCGSAANVAVPAGTMFILVDVVTIPDALCGVATTGTVTLTLH